MGNQAEMSPKTNEAINAALENSWEKAIELNRDLLEKFPDDIATMNRLARALAETGKLTEAKKTYKKILDLDPYNQIAEKNLNRISSIKKVALSIGAPSTSVRGDFFLEESGKTTIIPLNDTAMPQILADLHIGDSVKLEPHKNDITATSSSGRRIGKVQPESAKTIAQHIRSGSKFEAFIRSISIQGKNDKQAKPQVFVFIRELVRSPRVSTAPFPSSRSAFTPFVREEAFIRDNQASVLTEGEDGVEEMEVSELSASESSEDSLEELAEKENEESDTYDDD